MSKSVNFAYVNKWSYPNNIEKIQTILQLKAPNTLQYANIDPSVYIGGSLPALCQTSATIEEILSEINDIDVYTKNYVALCAGCQLDEFCQYIPNEFSDFYHVIENYDCDMIAIGYHPYSQKLLVTDRFINGLQKRTFAWFPNEIIDDPGEMRLQKIVRRAKKFFNAQIIVKRPANRFATAQYHKITRQGMCAPYLQFFFGKFICSACNKINGKMLCDNCIQTKSFELFNCADMKAVVLGGVNGFGGYITNELLNNNISTTATSRNVSAKFYDEVTQIRYDLDKGPSNELIGAMLDADIIILNACQTLEHDEKIWTNTIDNFDYNLAFQRFQTNALGYVKLFQQFIPLRRQIRKSQIIVFVDANESFYYDKILDGRHLELNMAKSAAKQVLCTNAGILAACGALTIAYNPGWMSFHGIDVNKDTGRIITPILANIAQTPMSTAQTSVNQLIPPNISAAGLVSYVLNNFHNIQNFFIQKKFMFDLSIYDLFNNYYLNNYEQTQEQEDQQDQDQQYQEDQEDQDQEDQQYQEDLRDQTNQQDQEDQQYQEDLRDQTNQQDQEDNFEFDDINDDEFWEQIVENTRMLKRD